MARDKKRRNQRLYTKMEGMGKKSFHSTDTGSSLGLERKTKGKSNRFKKPVICVFASSHADRKCINKKFHIV
jgi:hypothetical protein